jgi:EVE domain-containing protein
VGNLEINPRVLRLIHSSACSWLGIRPASTDAGSPQLRDDWLNFHDGFFLERATFKRQPSVKTGDGIVYYASGKGLVFAVGSVTSYAYELNETWSEEYQWVVNVKLEARREFIHDGVPLEDLEVDGRDLRMAMRRRSHLRVSDEMYDEALSLLR